MLMTTHILTLKTIMSSSWAIGLFGCIRRQGVK